MESSNDKMFNENLDDRPNCEMLQTNVYNSIDFNDKYDDSLVRDQDASHIELIDN